MNWLKHLAAAALLTLTLTTSAYAAEAILTYQDVANTTLQNAFAWGSTAYDTVTGAANKTCYRVQFFNPSNTLVATSRHRGVRQRGQDRFFHGPFRS